MTTYADTTDVATELGRSASTTAESDQWDAWLARVARSIARKFRENGFDLDTQIAAGLPTLDEVKDVQVARILAKIANPTGTTSITRSIDDASVTMRHEGADAGDPLVITDDEWATLIPIVRQSRAFSIMPL